MHGFPWNCVIAKMLGNYITYFVTYEEGWLENVYRRMDHILVELDLKQGL